MRLITHSHLILRLKMCRVLCNSSAWYIMMCKLQFSNNRMRSLPVEENILQQTNGVHCRAVCVGSSVVFENVLLRVGICRFVSQPSRWMFITTSCLRNFLFVNDGLWNGVLWYFWQYMDRSILESCTESVQRPHLHPEPSKWETLPQWAWLWKSKYALL